MKQPKLVVGLLAFVLVFIEHTSPLTQAQTVEPFPTLEACTDEIGHVALSPDGHYLGASLPFSHAIRIWDVETGKIVSTMTDERIEIRDQEVVTFSPDNKYFLISNNSTGIVLWDVLSGKRIRTFTSPNIHDEIITISFSPDGHSILATDLETGHSIWDVETGVEEMHFPEPGYLHSAFSPDGTRVVTQSGYPPLSIWDRKTGQRLHAFDIPSMVFGSGVFTPDGKYILVPEHNATILADAKTYRTVHVLGVATSPWLFSPDGKLAMTRKKPGTVYVWNLEKGMLVREFESPSPLTEDVIMGFLDNKTIFLTRDTSETPRPQIVLSVRDIQSGKEIRAFTIGIAYNSLHFTSMPVVKHFALHTLYPTSTLTLWDSETGKQILLDC
jgi:WD40 repeat protein